VTVPVTDDEATAEEVSLAERVNEALAAGRASGSERVYLVLRWSGATLFVATVVALVAVLIWKAAPAFHHAGLGFVFGGTWDPTTSTYGAGVFIIDTLITTALALLLAIPIGLATAAYLAALGPSWLTRPIAAGIDLLAAVPSIVVGLWAIFVLTPIFQNDVEPGLKDVPLLSHVFDGQALGSGLLLAAVVLAVMILPTMVALSRTALQAVAVTDREAAMALGGTRWQVVRTAVIPGARTGIEAAITLALGRALGEAIAVSLVIGGGRALPHSLLQTGSTLGSAVVNFFSEATSTLDRSAVVGLVVVLLAISALVNIGGQLILRRGRRVTGGTTVVGPPVANP
jgi:phosphate transport system permease protein